jgi:acyl-coenzyme A synthetase/AMP-(fatty) acid ligase
LIQLVRERKVYLFNSLSNISKSIVENLLKKEGIECACTGADDKLRIYVTNAGDKDKAAEFLVEHTGINRNGFKVFVVDKIPRNEAGKILYSALK